MPRAARKKSEESMYHVMSRSISEIDLFQCDKDKVYYLALLKRYIDKYCCKIYAYCVMDNHAHFFINTCGFDISTFMRGLNTAYVSYYNRKYHRHGHLFQGRFASTIVDSNIYGITLSAYIHNNSKDLPEYAGKEELYPYSSYGIYTGRRKNSEKIVDTEFLLQLFDGDKSAARHKYRNYTESIKDSDILNEIDDDIILAYTENVYNNEKSIVRLEMPNGLVRKFSEHFGEKKLDVLRAKYSREYSNIRAFAAYVMRALCGCTYKEICTYIGNMSMSGISRLSNKGFKLLSLDERYRRIFNSLIYVK